MGNALAAQLRAIADQLDNGAVSATGPTLTNGPCMNLDRDAFNATFKDGVAVVDRWVKGDIGIMKGALADHYNNAIVGASYWAGSIPLHLSVLVPPTPKTTTWVECLASAADVGWIPAGATYRPIAGADNMARWIEAGCPHANAGGAYDHRGELLPANQWQAYYDRLRAQAG